MKGLNVAERGSVSGSVRGRASKRFRAPLHKPSGEQECGAPPRNGLTEPANGRPPKQPGSLAPAALRRGFPAPPWAPVWAARLERQPELSTSPGSGDLPWSRFWRRAEGVRLPGCFGENNLQLRRSQTVIQKQKDFSHLPCCGWPPSASVAGTARRFGPNRGEASFTWESTVRSAPLSMS